MGCWREVSDGGGGGGGGGGGNYDVHAGPHMIMYDLCLGKLICGICGTDCEVGCSDARLACIACKAGMSIMG